MSRDLPVTVRPATLTDEPFLWEMLYQALYVPEGQLPFPRDIVHQPEISQYVQHWGKPTDLGFIAMVANQPIGAIWIRQINAYGFIDEETPELSMALLPDYRGQGIGTSLLNELLASARSQYKTISLSVSLDNPAKRLYERAGFVMISAAGSSITMKKEL